jgi:hypothetical protein
MVMNTNASKSKNFLYVREKFINIHLSFKKVSKTERFGSIVA